MRGLFSSHSNNISKLLSVNLIGNTRLNSEVSGTSRKQSMVGIDVPVTPNVFMLS